MKCAACSASSVGSVGTRPFVRLQPRHLLVHGLVIFWRGRQLPCREQFEGFAGNRRRHFQP